MKLFSYEWMSLAWGERPRTLSQPRRGWTRGRVDRGTGGGGKCLYFYSIFVPYLHDLVYGGVVPDVPDVGLSTAAATTSPAAVITANSLLWKAMKSKSGLMNVMGFVILAGNFTVAPFFCGFLFLNNFQRVRELIKWKSEAEMAYRKWWIGLINYGV